MAGCFALRAMTCGALIGVLAGLVAPGSTANTRPNAPDGPTICLQAAQHASNATGVPLKVLLAVSLTETGRRRDGRFVPWPWTLNVAGKGDYFDTRAAALAHARNSIERGEPSVDIGCFQINFRWHGENFDSLTAMMDPVTNATYAGEFLARLHGELGDWSQAAGAYHSRTPKYANRYRKIFDRNYAALGDVAPVPLSDPQPSGERQVASVRENRFPLLQGRALASRMGSLMPDNGGISGGLFSDRETTNLWGG